MPVKIYVKHYDVGFLIDIIFHIVLLFILHHLADLQIYTLGSL